MTYTREQLKQIDEMPIKNVYGKIVVLDFKEKPLAEIQGLVT
jgi:kynurenine formamidase